MNVLVGDTDKFENVSCASIIQGGSGANHTLAANYRQIWEIPQTKRWTFAQNAFHAVLQNPPDYFPNIERSEPVLMTCTMSRLQQGFGGQPPQKIYKISSL